MAPSALLIWPLIALIFFARLPAVPAVIWAVLIPYLFLPENYRIALPVLPDLDKTSIISLSLIVGVFVNNNKFTNELRLNPVTLGNATVKRMLTFCFVCLFAGTVFTMLGNRDILRYGSTVLPGLRPWDVVSMLSDIFFFVVPFFYARKYLASPEAHRQLLRAFVIMGLVYSVLMLIEIRLSPQLHNWIYGYHQHSFAQHIRDGFRPMVFLFHGLWVGFFMFMATISGFCLWKATNDKKWLIATIWIFLVLSLSENLAALLIAILGLILLTTLKQHMQFLVALVLSWTILLYPMLRQAQLIPIEQIMAAAATISPERADSLLFRLDNEDELLEKALERPVAGWGGYARERVYDEDGDDISVSEGRWIQAISTRGWIGYIGLFGLLTRP